MVSQKQRNKLTETETVAKERSAAVSGSSGESGTVAGAGEKKSRKSPKTSKNPKKNESDVREEVKESSPPVFRFVLTFVFVSALFLGGLGYYTHLSHSTYAPRGQFRLELKTPEPSWIKSDLCAVVENKTPDLRLLSFDDPSLAERVALAFQSDPVVKKTLSVSKRFPDTVYVDLEYRYPVAMVSVENGYYPIDRESVVLPTDNFAPANIRQYIVIQGIQSSPIHPVGSPWGDVRVESAAVIADQLRPFWKELRIVDILVHDKSAPQQQWETYFDLRLENRSLVRWTKQTFNGNNLEKDPNDLTVDEKIAILRKALSENKGALQGDKDKIFIFEK